MRIIKFKYRHTEKAHWEGKNGPKKRRRKGKGEDKWCDMKEDEE